MEDQKTQHEGSVGELFSIRVVVIDSPSSYRDLEFEILKALLDIFKERGVLGGKVLRTLEFTGERPVKERAALKWDKDQSNRAAREKMRRAISVTVEAAEPRDILSTIEIHESRAVGRHGLLYHPNGQDTNFLRRICQVISEVLGKHPDQIDFLVYPAQSEPKSVEGKKPRPSSGHRASRYRTPYPNHRTGSGSYATRHRR